MNLMPFSPTTGTDLEGYLRTVSGTNRPRLIKTSRIRLLRVTNKDSQEEGDVAVVWQKIQESMVSAEITSPSGHCAVWLCLVVKRSRRQSPLYKTISIPASFTLRSDILASPLCGPLP